MGGLTQSPNSSSTSTTILYSAQKNVFSLLHACVRPDLHAYLATVLASLECRAIMIHSSDDQAAPSGLISWFFGYQGVALGCVRVPLWGGGKVHPSGCPIITITSQDIPSVSWLLREPPSLNTACFEHPSTQPARRASYLAGRVGGRRC